jgi:DNA-binding CsgD family transcriptional regulator
MSESDHDARPEGLLMELEGLLMESVASPGFEVLEDAVTQVYRYVAERGAIGAVPAVAADVGLDAADVGAAIEILIEHRLLREHTREDNLPGSRFVAVNPEIAAASLISPMEREIYVRREQIARIQARMDALRHDYARIHPAAPGPSPVDHVVGATEVAGYLKVAADACREDVLVLRPGGELEGFLELGPVLSARGVTLRLICEHRCRADFTVRTKIKNLMDGGAEVATISHVPRAAVVFDRSLAVLLGAVDGTPAASGVRSGPVIQFLTDMFGYLWDGATPVESFESGYSEVADDLQSAIVNLMAKGLTDEVLARKLGMSVRTCRRHISAVMRDLNAASRFQAGVRAVTENLIDRS